jgi:hypothetical protein
MHLCMTQTLRLEQKLEQRLTIKQRLVIKQELIMLTRNLIHAIRGDQYNPEAKCPACRKILNAAEIVTGFLRDPEDITTKCPKCSHRFNSLMIHKRTGIRSELLFYCPSQVLHRIEKMSHLTPEQIEKENMAIYHSALFHFGSLKEAFKKIDINYPHKIKLTWKDKVLNFLGELPDTIIAKHAGVSPSTVGRYRKKLEIDPFNRYDLL